MPRWRLWTSAIIGGRAAITCRVCRDQDGSASLEFLTVGLLLLVPTVYLVLTLAAVQGASLAADGAARQAARVYVQSESTAAADEAVESAVEVTLADYGIESSTAAVQVECVPHPSRCLTRQGTVTVTVGVTVPLPLVPAALGISFPAAVPVQATASEQVSRFWGSR